MRRARDLAPRTHGIAWIALVSMLSACDCSGVSTLQTGGLDGAFDTGTADVADAGRGVSILLLPTAGLRTTEAGGSTLFAVSLSDQPTANVTIALISDDLTEGTVSPLVLTFTPDDWNGPHNVTVTGVDDDVADGDQVFTISTVPAGSTDVRYAGQVGAVVTVTNTDDETAGISVSAISGQVAEFGLSATFSVVLNSAPTADVMIAVSSTDPSEGSVSPSILTFTPDNWRAPQLVTVTGVDDDRADGLVAFAVVTAAATSTDANYAGVDADDLSVENVDDETASVIVSATSGPTDEDGATASFTVMLTSAPDSDVVIGVASDDATEGTAATTDLTFTSIDWHSAQRVTVTGRDDDLADGTQPYNIVLGPAVSDDAVYNGFDPPDVAMLNVDNDSPGVAVSAVSGPTTEAGGRATFTMVLRTQPTADVTFAVTVSNAAEGTVSPASVAFTSANWRAPQTITLTGVDDNLADGDRVYTAVIGAAASTDVEYDGIDPPDVTVTNSDNETPGITVSPISGDVSEGGRSATFTVVLDSRPTANVTMTLSSDDTSEGTVSTAQLVFSPDDWNAPQLITITGVDDDLADGTRTFRIVIDAATSSDPLYAGLNAADVMVDNVDNDSAGITVSAIDGPTGEDGSSATFTIVLNSQPTDPVVIALSSSNVLEGTVSSESVTFTVDNWNSTRMVTVTGEDDVITDGNQPYTVVIGAAVSADVTYDGLDAPDVQVINVDNETPGILVSSVRGSTGESGAIATLTIRLQSEPSDDVVVGVSSSDVSEGTLTITNLRFTAVNWASPQTVTVTGVNDSVADGDQQYRIDFAPATSTDEGYTGLTAPSRDVINIDNDTAGISLSNASTDTTEAGGTATVTIVLDSQPTRDVAIALSSSRVGEGTVSPTSVTFTPVNWNVARTVTLTGVDDAIADGAQTFLLATAAAVSADPGYSGLDARDVPVTNTDNDSAGIIVSTISGNTSENGGTATFTIQLTSQPLANVRISVVSDDTNEGTAFPAFPTFTPANWTAVRTVTVTGVNDSVVDGDRIYTIRLLPATSADPAYSGINPPDVTVINEDNDSIVIIVSGISGPTTEAGGTATFLIALTSQPTETVTIGLTSSNPAEATVSDASVTFSVSDWNTPALVTVTGVDDSLDDGDVPYTIITSPASSLDPLYNGVDPANVDGTNFDDD